MEIEHHQVQLNGIRYHYAEAKGARGHGALDSRRVARPLVVLIHGFPELWYSFRHQLSALARVGYHAVAPDLRGFGESEVPKQVEAYSLFRHADDVRALIQELGASKAVLVGHDWGANLAWLMALRHPGLVQAVVALSIPFYPEPRDPREIRRFAAGHFNFLEYFQRPGATETEFRANPRLFLHSFFYGLSGDAPAGTIDRLYLHKPANAKLLDGFPEPKEPLGWLSERDLEHYVTAFDRTGISGALGFYRNMDHDFPELRRIYQGRIDQPALFIGGGEEAAVRFGSLEPMRAAVPKLGDTVILPGSGHWVQQERAEAVNRAIIAFLEQQEEIWTTAG